jgi:hypothetical protein
VRVPLAAIPFLFLTTQAHASPISGLTHLWNVENNLTDVVGGPDGSAIGGSGFGAGKVGGNAVDLTGGHIDVATEVIADQQAAYSWPARCISTEPWQAT